MSLSLILGALWGLAATIVAMLPMRHQFKPGFALLLAAPFLIGFIGWQHGGWIAVLGLLAFLSMFRRPLMYFGRKALGRPVPELPVNERKKP